MATMPTTSVKRSKLVEQLLVTRQIVRVLVGTAIDGAEETFDIILRPPIVCRLSLFVLFRDFEKFSRDD